MPRLTVAAGLAAALGVVSAAVSAYWAAGGTWLLDTVGGDIERWGREGGAGVTAALAVVVVLKLIAVVLPLAAVQRPARWIRRLAWVEGWFLTVYGGVLTLTGALVETGVLAPGRHPDWRALNWHFYLWDPWFGVWGVAVLTALWASRARSHVSAHGI